RDGRPALNERLELGRALLVDQPKDAAGDHRQGDALELGAEIEGLARAQALGGGPRQRLNVLAKYRDAIAVERRHEQLTLAPMGLAVEKQQRGAAKVDRNIGLVRDDLLRPQPEDVLNRVGAREDHDVSAREPQGEALTKLRRAGAQERVGIGAEALGLDQRGLLGARRKWRCEAHGREPAWHGCGLAAPP